MAALQQSKRVHFFAANTDRLRRAFTKAPGAVAIAAAFYSVPALVWSFGVGIWVGRNLPESLINVLRDWCPTAQMTSWTRTISYRNVTLPIVAMLQRIPWDIQLLFVVVWLVIQGAVLFVAVCLMRCVGWSGSWRELGVARRRSLLVSTWWKSTLGLAIAIVVANIIWEVFLRIDVPRVALDIGTGELPYQLNGWSILVMQALIAAHILTRSIPLIAGPVTERWCVRCGYRLMTPAATTCPECGLVEAQPFVIHPARSQCFRAHRWNKWGFLLWIIPFLMLMAPVTLPQLRLLNHAIWKFLHG
ncbi:MAG: hypothetical protein K8R92_11360 [Planctomycetes bacterium]|nr:hypothetical protein [Planctomycetota bacterium]